MWYYVCVHAKSLHSHLTLWDPMVFSPPNSSVHAFFRQEYWSGLNALLQGIFLTQWSKPHLLRLLQVDSLLLSHWGDIMYIYIFIYVCVYIYNIYMCMCVYILCIYIYIYNEILETSNQQWFYQTIWHHKRSTKKKKIKVKEGTLGKPTLKV